MEKNITPFIMVIVGILIFALLVNIGVSIYEPSAVKSAVKATTNQTFTVDGTSYTATGNGQSASEAVQEVHDNVSTVRTTANVLLGIVFLIAVILGAVSLLKKHS